MRNTDWKHRGASTERTKDIKLQNQKNMSSQKTQNIPKLKKTEIPRTMKHYFSIIVVIRKIRERDKERESTITILYIILTEIRSF